MVEKAKVLYGETKASLIALPWYLKVLSVATAIALPFPGTIAIVPALHKLFKVWRTRR